MIVGWFRSAWAGKLKGCAAGAVLALLAGCGHAPMAGDAPKLGYAGEEAAPALRASGRLAGRTMSVGSVGDIRLRRGEVVLTFDDGPSPGNTPLVLGALRQAGVRATFLMVGSMAQANPALVRKVAAEGHTIGTHTQRHRNLRGMSLSAAQSEIAAGQRSVSAALGPSGYRAAPFFRFPYLASTVALRQMLARQGVTVIDVDIDSKDYFQGDGARKRTMAALARRGSGIILLHDIHRRTASMLPSLLADLRAGGYKVVHLVPRGGGIGDGLLMSSLAGR